MFKAFERAKQNKNFHYEVMKFEFNLEKNIINIIDNIKNNKYIIGKYREFTVYEPKERIIKALPFRDRVVHQWYVHEFLLPNIVPRFIYDSYACIKGKGTHNAVSRLELFMKSAKNNYGDYYVLKMDVKKFFYSIDPNVLLKIIKKYFDDKAFINLTEKLIFEKNVRLGIPIGNYTSQYFANIYLNELDQYVKHELKIKYYLRFMDDFVLLVESRELAKKLFFEIKNFLINNLNLELNHKSSYYPSALGVDFCGYKVFHTHRLVRKRSKKKMLERIKRWNFLYENDCELDLLAIRLSINSWKAHIKHANNYNLYKYYIGKINFDVPIKDLYLMKEEREKRVVQLSFFDD